jgi:hypothetical protein
VAHACNPSIQEAASAGSKIKASLGYIARFCLKKKKGIDCISAFDVVEKQHTPLDSQITRSWVDFFIVMLQSSGVSSCSVVETESCCVAQADLKLLGFGVILLPQPPKHLGPQAPATRCSLFRKILPTRNLYH